MDKKKLLLLLIPMVLASCSYEVSEVNGGKDINPFDFVGNSEISELEIDGKRDETQWQEGEYTSPEYKFRYTNYLNQNVYEYSIQIYRGIKELFVFFKVNDCNIVTYGNDNGSNVVASDECEIYLDTQLNRDNKPQTDDYQINLGVHEKTRMLVGNGSGWTNWNGIVQYGTFIDGTLNDETDIDNYYCIEVSLPYKQIGITRDQTIGITFGLCDRYSLTGGTTSKRWYRTVINNHYGNPQDPSTYFELNKNEVTTPSIPIYNPGEDETIYASNCQMHINGSTVGDDTFEEVEYKIALHNNKVTALASTKVIWPSFEGICLSFDFGNRKRTTRDENTIILRAFPGSHSFLDFYRYPNIGLDKTSVDIRMSDNYLYVSFDISSYMTDDFEGVNFCASTITVEDNIVQELLRVDKFVMTQQNLNTYGTITKDNIIEMQENKNEYNYEEDDTTYIGVPMTIASKVDSVDDDVFEEKGIEISRTKDIVTVLFHNDGLWSPNEQLVLFYDFGSPTRTQRDNNVVILRLFPRSETLYDFFYFESKAQIDRSLLCVSYYKQEVKVEFTITDIVSSIPNYKDEGVGFTAAIANRKSEVLGFCTFNGRSQGTDPSKWARMAWNNTLIGA